MRNAFSDGSDGTSHAPASNASATSAPVAAKATRHDASPRNESAERRADNGRACHACKDERHRPRGIGLTHEPSDGGGRSDSVPALIAAAHQSLKKLHFSFQSVCVSICLKIPAKIGT
ncbi:hypothetical protein [Caballeronia glebae]|uniref:hypothetical protein n=1 Tax=Caballeronia glebae TaxID=1777143 RepID=UPI00117DD565|nr:hypothetical protein [Caballeronia glebae]